MRTNLSLFSIAVPPSIEKRKEAPEASGPDDVECMLAQCRARVEEAERENQQRCENHGIVIAFN